MNLRIIRTVIVIKCHNNSMSYESDTQEQREKKLHVKRRIGVVAGGTDTHSEADADSLPRLVEYRSDEIPCAVLYEMWNIKIESTTPEGMKQQGKEKSDPLHHGWTAKPDNDLYDGVYSSAS